MHANSAMRIPPDLLDDRMAHAVSLINEHLSAANLPALTYRERRSLRLPGEYRAQLASKADAGQFDPTTAEALLSEWHAWHGR